jgi:hypothetical protein
MRYPVGKSHLHEGGDDLSQQVFFPAWPGDPHCDLQEEKLHSEKLDERLGLRAHHGIETQLTCEETQTGNSEQPQQWRGLALQSLLTPYTELRRMILDLDERFQPGHLVELGSGYSRLAHVLHACSPIWTYCGYEVVPERHAEAVRWRDARGLPASRYELRCEDLRGLPLPAADVYFMYDYSDRASIEATVAQLQDRARQGHRIVLVGRGGLTRSTIEKLHPWLAEVISPLHRSRYSIYQSAT